METVDPVSCFDCGAWYSGGALLVCPACERRQRLRAHADDLRRDPELWQLRQLAALQRLGITFTPAGMYYRDDYGGEG